jgi:proline dehydrogenase
MRDLMISQGYQDLRDVAREREFTGKMIAGIKKDIKRILQSTFPEVEKLVNVFSRNDNAVCVFMKWCT